MKRLLPWLQGLRPLNVSEMKEVVGGRRVESFNDVCLFVLGFKAKNIEVEWVFLGPIFRKKTNFRVFQRETIIFEYCWSISQVSYGCPGKSKQ